MSRPGRKPKPASVIIAQGNPGRRPIGRDPEMPTMAVGSPPAPSWLAGDGLSIWTALAPRLVCMKLLSHVDAEAFARYCRNFARWHRMQTQLDEEGETYESEGAHGSMKRAHPAFVIADRLEKALQAAEDRFGLNPAERQRLFAVRASSAQTSDLFGQAEREAYGEDEDEKQGLAGRRQSPVGLLN